MLPFLICVCGGNFSNESILCFNGSRLVRMWGMSRMNSLPAVRDVLASLFFKVGASCELVCGSVYSAFRVAQTPTCPLDGGSYKPPLGDCAIY